MFRLFRQSTRATLPPNVPLQHQSPPKKLFFLLDLYPYVAKDRARYDDDAVRESIRRAPNAAKVKCSFTAFYGDFLYPLPVAIALGASPETVQLLCDAHPEAIHETDNFGWTPLHFACRYPKGGAQFDVVLLLLEKDPSAISTKDVDGFTPLHWACFNGAPAEVVGILAERCPAAMDIKNKRGNSPLMLARAYNRIHKTSQDVSRLLETLHTLLCLHPSDEEVLAMLRQSNGEKWSSCTSPILRHRPSIVQMIGIHFALMPALLGKVGQDGRLETMFQIVRESMGLFGG